MKNSSRSRIFVKRTESIRLCDVLGAFLNCASGHRFICRYREYLKNACPAMEKLDSDQRNREK